jgi:hypothetical protein
MKTTINKRNKEYIRIEQNTLTLKPSGKLQQKEDNDVEVHMIQMGPSFLGMPGWKFFVVKDKK